MNADERAGRNTASRRRGALALGAALLSLLLGLCLPAAGFGQVQQLQPGVTLEAAVEIATRRHPGRVVRAVTVDAGGGRRMHEVRILSDEGGRVITVRVDARTGRVR